MLSARISLLGARGFSCAISDFATRVFGLRPNSCRPMANETKLPIAREKKNSGTQGSIYGVMDRRGKFGEHERCVRVARASYNQLQKYLRHCTVFWHKWPVHDLVLVIPPPPLSKLLAIQDHTQTLKEQLWMGGRGEVSIISYRRVTRSDLKQERSFFRGSVSTFLQLVVWVLHTPIAVVHDY